MIEYTYEGMVRHGFGFHNPNHAAALICAVIPFLLLIWMKYRQWFMRFTTGIIIAVLLFMLALTYSRSGVLVLALELLLFSLMNRNLGWKLPLTLFAFLVAVLVVIGASNRFNIDNSVTNRLLIWQSGASLFRANLWHGVGLGNSGLLASSLLLPRSITCATLINSHLTLVVESGILWGGAYLWAIFYALLKGIHKKETWIAFFGLCFSASLSTAISWYTLFNVDDYAFFSRSNTILAWMLCLVFAGMLVYLAWGRIEMNKLLCSGTLSLFVLVFLFFAAKDTVKVEGKFILTGDASILVLYDDNFDLTQVNIFLDRYGYDDCRIAMRPVIVAPTAPPTVDTIILFASCAEMAGRYPGAQVIFVAPPAYFLFPEQSSKVYLKRFSAVPLLETQLRTRHIAMEYF